jgi:conjugative transfer region protein (TIGR03750 family)
MTDGALAQLDHQTANRMAGEPPILRGCSSSELLVIAIIATAVWLPLCVVVGLSAGYATMGIGVASLLIGASVWGGTFVLQILKRNRPDAYYQQRILLALQRRRLWSFGYNLPDGPLSLGRRWPCR